MAAGVQTEAWNGQSRRRVPRFLMQAPMDLTVLRSGVPDTLPGRSVNVCERGVAAIVAGELVAGESVGVELQLPPLTEPLRMRALVRYQDRLRCGLEFVSLSAEQRAAIRDWAREAKATTESVPASAITAEEQGNEPEAQTSAPIQRKRRTSAKRKERRSWWAAALLILVSGLVVWMWHWNHAWDELESGLKNPQAGAAEKARAQVPAEVMEKLLVHRVEPTYPAEARKDRLEGTIALDIVIGRDGSVQGMHAL